MGRRLKPLRTQWTIGDVWDLRVAGDGSETRASPPYPGAPGSLRVRIVEVGAGFVVEETWLRTIEDWTEPVCRFVVVPPRGRGWKRDAEADKDHDKSSCWRRRRDWEIA